MAIADSDLQVDRYSFDIFASAIWILIEAETSIIVACLPCLAPLFRSRQHIAFEVRALPSMPSLQIIHSKLLEAPSKVGNISTKQVDGDEGRSQEHSKSTTGFDGNIAGDSNVEVRTTDIV